MGIDNISHSNQQSIKKLILIFFSILYFSLLISCHPDNKVRKKIPQSGEVLLNFKNYSKTTLSTNTGRLIIAYVAKSPQEQTQGLSGVKPESLKDNEGMFFEYDKPGPRSFWMPNTYVNLDIFFLDSNNKVLYVERNLPSHPGMNVPPVIARTKTIYAHNVLELKADSTTSKEIKIGDILTRHK